VDRFGLDNLYRQVQIAQAFAPADAENSTDSQEIRLRIDSFRCKNEQCRMLFISLRRFWNILCFGERPSGSGELIRHKERERMRASFKPAIPVARETVHEVLWRQGSARAEAQVLPKELVVVLSGRCHYENMVELSFYIGRRWDRAQKKLIVDFSKTTFVDQKGIHFLMNNLCGAPGVHGEVCLVRAPRNARDFAHQAWTGHKITFVQDLKQALSFVHQQKPAEKTPSNRPARQWAILSSLSGA
jgi:anti-anti-sigma regulatory factor